MTQGPRDPEGRDKIADVDTLLDVRAVRQRVPWLQDDRAARRIIEQAGGRIIAGRWAVPLDLLRRWERAWQQHAVAHARRQAARRVVDDAQVVLDDVPDELDADWWRS